MKKFVVLLMAASIISMGAAQAEDGPITKWLNNTTSNISKKEQTAYQKAQAKKQKAAKKKAEAKKKQIEREKKIAQKKAERQKKQAERKKRVETKKKQWKELFSTD